VLPPFRDGLAVEFLGGSAPGSYGVRAARRLLTNSVGKT
jgi:hypothetical protein